MHKPYEVAKGFHITQSQAKLIGPVVERLEAEARLTPEALVEEARNPECPVHALMEWNDEEAAHLYRVDKARYWIQGIVIRPPETLRANEFRGTYVFAPEHPETADLHSAAARVMRRTEAQQDASMRLYGQKRSIDYLEKWTVELAFWMDREEEWPELITLVRTAIRTWKARNPVQPVQVNKTSSPGASPSNGKAPGEKRPKRAEAPSGTAVASERTVAVSAGM